MFLKSLPVLLLTHILLRRKKLLKGIEEIRRNGKVGNNPPPPPSSGGGVTDNDATTNVGAEPKQTNGNSNVNVRQHWSTVKPLNENVVTGGTSTDSASLLSGGGYDEAAESAAFKSAVMEWRSGTSSITTAQPVTAGEGEYTVSVRGGVMDEAKQVSEGPVSLHCRSFAIAFANNFF